MGCFGGIGLGDLEDGKPGILSVLKLGWVVRMNGTQHGGRLECQYSVLVFVGLAEMLPSALHLLGGPKAGPGECDTCRHLLLWTEYEP